MACEECTRLFGTGLRNVRLRRILRDLQIHSDTMFRAFCEDRATAAMGELWGSGEFDCGPQDYQFIAERCLAAVRENNERRKNPS